MQEPRNKLVIIGNGFDLAHGLKTSYKDFIEWYLKKCLRDLNDDPNLNEYEDELIKISFKKNERYKLSPDDQFYQYINLQSSPVRFEPKRILRRIFEQNRTYIWVDIEMEYYRSLIDIYKFFENGNNYSIYKNPESLNKDFNFIKQKLEEYLSTIKCSFKNKEIEPIQDILDLFNNDFNKGYFKREEKQVHYLNFNYTKTIEDYINIASDTNYELNYIHGELNNPDNPIVFGYGDEIDSHYKKIEDLNNNEFLKNFKSFAYFKTGNYQKLLRFIDAEPYDIEILGHSCGLSDRVLLNTLFEHDNCESIKIHYYEHEKGNDFTTKTQEISRHFKDKAKMRKRVLNFTKCMPLVKFQKL